MLWRDLQAWTLVSPYAETSNLSNSSCRRKLYASIDHLFVIGPMLISCAQGVAVCKWASL